MTAGDVAAKFGPDTLLVFVGHSGDASEEADAIKKLESDLQRMLERRLEVMNRKPSYSRLRIWKWDCDADSRPGGQKRLIDPYLREARVAVFVFKEKVGKVTWEELELKRNEVERQDSVLVLFPKNCPCLDRWDEPGSVEEWAQLLRKKEFLVSDWTEHESRSIKPLPLYEDCDSLKRIVLDAFDGFLGTLLTPIPERTTERFAVQHPSSEHDPRSMQAYIDRLTNISEYEPRTLTRYRRSCAKRSGSNFPTPCRTMSFSRTLATTKQAD